MNPARLSLVVAISVAFASHGVAAQYFETSFERDQGYTEGRLANPDLPWNVVTGEAIITDGEPQDGLQALQMSGSDPIARLRVQSRILAAEAIVYVDCWIRPPASADDAEFLDFDGALVSFRQAGDQGEFSIFHATGEKTGHWITTGQRFDLSELGQASDWIRVTILRDYTTGSWHLWLDGQVAFQNIRALPADDPEVRAAWIVGNESTSLDLDNFYLGAVNPFALRPDRRGTAAAINSTTGLLPQTVGPRTNPVRSSSDPEIGDQSDFLPEPILRGYSFEGKQGGEINIPKRVINFLEDSDDLKVSAFVPRYDEDGNPLPMEITFTADVELRPGADLRRIFWNVRRLPKSFEPRIDGDLLMRGSFDSSLARVVTVPGEDVRRGLSVNVAVD